MKGAPQEAKDPGWRDRFAWVSGTKWERVENRVLRFPRLGASTGRTPLPPMGEIGDS